MIFFFDGNASYDYICPLMLNAMLSSKVATSDERIALEHLLHDLLDPELN